MSPFIPMLAGILANKMFADGNDDQAKRQMIAQMHMQMAQRFAPDMPTFGFQAAQLKDQMARQRDEGQRQLLASLVPAAVQGVDSMSAADTGQQWSEYGGAQSDKLAQMYRAQQPSIGTLNPFRGLDGNEDW